MEGEGGTVQIKRRHEVAIKLRVRFFAIFSPNEKKPTYRQRPWVDPDQTAEIPTKNPNLTKYNKVANSFKQPLNSNFCFLSAKIIVCKMFNSKVSVISQPLQVLLWMPHLVTECTGKYLKDGGWAWCQIWMPTKCCPMLLKENFKHQNYSWCKGIMTMAAKQFKKYVIMVDIHLREITLIRS